LRAGELAETRDRHLQHHLEALVEESAEDAERNGRQLSWDWLTVQRRRELSSNLDAAIDWAVATDRQADAGELLVASQPVLRESLNVRATLERIDVVRAALPETSDLRERLVFAEIDAVVHLDDECPVRAIVEIAEGSSDPVVSEIALAMRANQTAMVDPVESLRLTGEVAQRTLLR